MVRRKSYGLALKKIRPFIKGVIAGMITMVIFTVAGAMIFNIADAPEGTDTILGYIVLGACAAVCGMFYGGGRRKNGFAWGTLGGITMFVLCLTGAVVSGGFSGAELLAKLLTSAICGCIGGIIGVNIAADR